MPWNRKDSLVIHVNVDEDGLLGKIAEARCKLEELSQIIGRLHDEITFKEEPTTDAGSSSEKTSQDI